MGVFRQGALGLRNPFKQYRRMFLAWALSMNMSAASALMYSRLKVVEASFIFYSDALLAVQPRLPKEAGQTLTNP